MAETAKTARAGVKAVTAKFPLRKRLPAPIMIVWLTVVWVLLWGDITWANVVNGVLLSYFVCIAMPLPRAVSDWTVRPLAVVRLVVAFLWDALMGAIHVAEVAVRKAPPEPAIIRVQLRTSSEVVLSTVAGMITLVPGSVAIEVHRLTSVLYFHVFDVRGDNPQERIEEMRRVVLRQEERVMRAFMPKRALEAAGMTPGWRMGRRPV